MLNNRRAVSAFRLVYEPTVSPLSWPSRDRKRREQTAPRKYDAAAEGVALGAIQRDPAAASDGTPTPLIQYPATAKTDAAIKRKGEQSFDDAACLRHR